MKPEVLQPACKVAYYKLHSIVNGPSAGDCERFRPTQILSKHEAKSGQVVAIGVHGKSLWTGRGSMGGLDSFNPMKSITSRIGNNNFEIDCIKALDYCRSYLGPRTKGLPDSGLLLPLAAEMKNQ